MKDRAVFGPSRQEERLAFIIQEIVHLTHPEKILLLSATYNYQLKEDIFLKNPVQAYTGVRYELLILVDGRDAKKMLEQEILIGKKLQNQADLHVHMMNIHEFNKGIEVGDEYFKFLLLNAFIRYDRGQIH